MIARPVKALSSLVVVLLAAACTNSFEIPIETPIRPKLDVAAFQRVLVAGFIAGGTEDVDGNLETTRLLRSQLRTKSQLRVIDSDVLPLRGCRRRGTRFRWCRNCAPTDQRREGPRGVRTRLRECRVPGKRSARNISSR